MDSVLGIEEDDEDIVVEDVPTDMRWPDMNIPDCSHFDVDQLRKDQRGDEDLNLIIGILEGTRQMPSK